MSTKLPKVVRKTLDREGERLLGSLQTPKAKRGLDKAFRASPEEMGRAAVRAAKKSRTEQR